MFLKSLLIILIFISFSIYSQTVVVDYEFVKYNNKGKACLLEKSGKKLTKFIYDDIEILNDNAFIIEKEGLFGVISKNGNVILEPLYEYYFSIDFGIIQFEFENKSLIVNTKFKSVSEALDYVSFFENGYAEVELNQKNIIVRRLSQWRNRQR